MKIKKREVKMDWMINICALLGILAGSFGSFALHSEEGQKWLKSVRSQKKSRRIGKTIYVIVILDFLLFFVAVVFHGQVWHFIARGSIVFTTPYVVVLAFIECLKKP